MVSPITPYLRQLILSSLAICLWSISPAAVAGPDRLVGQYNSVKNKLTSDTFGVPIHLEADGGKRIMQGDVYSVVDHPFPRVRDALRRPANWCDIAGQHMNIKACVYRPVDKQCQLTFYAGGRHYDDLAELYRLNYNYEFSQHTKDYFQTVLSASQGPYGTKDYQIIAEAIPLDPSSTFLHFRYSVRYGTLARVAMRLYLATFGRNKIGFTVVKQNRRGNPVYVKGMQGVVERNSMRYYFAIQSYLDAEGAPASKRFETRIQSWFGLIDKHRRQLYEIERKDYLKDKRREQLAQEQLQLRINQTTTIRQSPSGTACGPGNKVALVE